MKLKWLMWSKLIRMFHVCEICSGAYIDKKCPFTGTVSIRGRILAGTCHSAKMQRTIIVRRNYLHFVKKYQRWRKRYLLCVFFEFLLLLLHHVWVFNIEVMIRYEKRHSNIPAHVSPCFRVKEGDHVIIGQCRWGWQEYLIFTLFESMW